ncbi:MULTISPECIES: hypothetical protein [unclassified Duganella]|uniref:hypothetical protein n=1 Tax=unclassified Duganella TaxID=2636909 RepID=UPI0011135DB6|nr:MULTISPECIES: hypothetical protein [unclassified Duganella]
MLSLIHWLTCRRPTPSHGWQARRHASWSHHQPGCARTANSGSRKTWPAPLWLVQDLLDDGTLTRVLPQWHGQPQPLHGGRHHRETFSEAMLVNRLPAVPLDIVMARLFDY